MVYPTLSSYKENYKANLRAFLNQYEDNTENFFRQAEKKKYQDYQNALIKIANQLNSSTAVESNSILLQRNIASDLKNMDCDIYNTIITELNPVLDKTVLSLSAAKNDKIQVDETALENHIKSSIVILKFISNKNEEELNIKEVLGEEFTIDSKLEQAVAELWQWYWDYGCKHDQIYLLGILNEKCDYVIDTYKNYEQRYLEYHLDNCKIFLQEFPDDIKLHEWEKLLENNLVQLRKLNPIPTSKIEDLITQINNAFYRLEQFMKGKVHFYKSFYFNDAFTLLTNELNKLENLDIKYHYTTNDYWYFMHQLANVIDKGAFENDEAYNNVDFIRDWNEINYIQADRLQDLCGKTTLKDFQIEQPSILNVFSTDEKEPQIPAITKDIDALINLTNPYPRIFTSPNGFNKFQKLVDEFGNTKQNLSNYSFVYHSMIKDKLIYADYKQTEFVYFLHDFNISIDRIKPKSQLGKADLRESIYNNLK